MGHRTFIATFIPTTSIRRQRILTNHGGSSSVGSTVAQDQGQETQILGREIRGIRPWIEEVPHLRNRRINRARLGDGPWESQVGMFGEATELSPRVRTLGWQRESRRAVRERKLGSIVVLLRALRDDRDSGIIHQFLHATESVLLPNEPLPAWWGEAVHRAILVLHQIILVCPVLPAPLS